MKNIKLILVLVFLSILFTGCQKEPDTTKQYLFDGLPYYLADTLFYTDGSSREMFRPYDIHLDSKGYVWTRDFSLNLSRYDAETEEVIRWNTLQVLGVVPPYALWTIFLDSKDRLWCGDYNMLHMFDGTSYQCFNFSSPDFDLACEMSEDIEGNIHFHGVEAGIQYICDGVSVVQSDPDFTTDDIYIYKMASDKERNLWYFVDMTPGVADEGTYAVRYKNKNEYRMIQEIHDGDHLEDFRSIKSMTFDSNNTPYIFVMGILMRINSNEELETLWDDHRFGAIILYELYSDRENNIWASIQKDNEDDPNIGIFKDGEWITVSPYMKAIRDRNVVLDIDFPDDKTVWVCTTGGVFVFKK